MRMKKTLFHIVFAILAIVAATSCNSTLEQDIPEPRPSFPEGATVTLGFCTPYGVATKATGDTDMKEEPFIESMHVFFFDEDGTHLIVRKAKLSAIVRENYDPANENEFTMLSYWTVDNVDMTVDKRILHFVANLPDDRVPKMGSESSVFRSLSVEYPRASYWQRIELEDGIQPYAYDGTAYYDYIDASGVLHEHEPVPGTYDSTTESYTTTSGTTVNKGDYINVNGDKIVNGTGYYYVPAANSPLRSMIPLIRNFVKIKFVNNWNKFELKKIALVNTPAEGLVAPYRTPASSSAPRFETSYLWTDSWTPGYIPTKEAVSGNAYAPVLAAAGIDGNPLPAGFIEPASQEATLFMYERGLPSVGDATSILIGGLVSATGTTEDPYPPVDSNGYTWFRLEITDSGGDYYPFYRNFTYQVSLNSIEKPGKHGHGSFKEALDHVALGNISNAKETESLTQVNDGDGLTLWVNYVDYTTVGGGSDVALIYTFYHDNAGTKTYYPDRVQFHEKRNTTTGSNLEFATNGVATQGLITSSSPYWDNRPTSDLNWYLAMVTLKPQSNDILQNDVEVEGATLASDPIGHRKLTRLVTYTVTRQQKLRLSITPIGVNEADRPTHLTVTLPNTLTRSAFPLSLRIESEDNCITPLDKVTAKVGPSTFDGSTKNAYYFVKTIEYSEYESLETKEFTFHFITTKATNRTAPLVTRIKVTENKTDDEEHLFYTNDANATCELTCNPSEVTGIVLNKDIAWVKMGQPEQLEAHVEPWNAVDLAFTWSNSNDAVATVDANGLVTPHSYGTTTVTVTSNTGSFTDECEVRVYNPITSITLTPDLIYIGRGSTATIAADIQPNSGDGLTWRGVTWTSSNESVATVSSTGEVTAHSAGYADITATATDGSGLSATCVVTVYIPVSGITLNKTEMTLRQNWTEILTATISPSNASDKNVEWESSNPAVATVNEYGEVTAVADSGTATITAKSHENNSITATCVVTAVPNPVTSVVISETSTTIEPYPWGTKTLTASVKPSNASDTAIDWSSDDPSVATVVNGVVTAVSSTNGATTTIRAKAHSDNSIEATCTVTVVYTPVTGVTLDESSKMLPLGASFTLTATVAPGNATQKAVNWSSDDPSVATVDANGVVTASGSNTGTATITATTVDGGYTATCTVQVYKPVTGVSLNHSSEMLVTGATLDLTATVSPSDATNKTISWESSDPTIATVASTGDNTARVTASSTKSGIVTITVRTEDGNKTATCTVTVVKTRTENTTYANGFRTGSNNLSFGDLSIYFSNLNQAYNGYNYVRPANNATITIGVASGYAMAKVIITFNGSNYTHNYNPGVGDHSLSGSTWTWTTGNAPTASITMTNDSGNNTRIIASVEVFYYETE